MPVRVVPRQEFREQINFGENTLDTNLYFLIKMFKRIRRGFAPIVMVCGSQRTGKSFVAIWLAWLYMYLQGKEFDPVKQTFYEPIEAVKFLKEANNTSFVLDEAGAYLNRRKWYSELNHIINATVQTMAFKTNLFIFVSPFSADLDRAIHKHIDYLLRVDYRGHFRAFGFIKKYDEFKQEKATRRFFMDDVSIPMSSLPKEIWTKYMEYSEAMKDKYRQELVDKHDAGITPEDSDLNIFERLKKQRVF